jgi:hypothetical protein
VRQPFHQALLVDVFDAAAAFARIEERFLVGALSTAYATGIGLISFKLH